MHEKVAKIPEIFVVGVFGLLLLIAAGMVEALTFEEQHCLRGNESDCVSACQSNPNFCTYVAPVTDSETEQGKGCNPFTTRQILQNIASAKLESRGFTVTDCDPHEHWGKNYYLPKVNRSIKGVPRNTSTCNEKDFHFNPGLSENGPEWELIEICWGEK